MIATVAELAPRLGVAPTCTALEVPRASYYRSLSPRPEPQERPTPARALPVEERQAVLDVLHEPRFADLAPTEVYATLLDEGRYLCSERTLYRVLAENAEVRERRDQVRHPHYAAPELLATRPNELWSWDITRLLGPTKWTYYYLYVLLDVFSRYVVGWLLAQRESTALAEKLIAESCERQEIQPGQLTVHADRGAPMIAKSMAFLLADLGITKTHSRPHVSNDNPFSESHFKTLKYRPDFPERFPHGRPQPKALPTAVWINPPKGAAGAGVAETASAAWTQDSDPLEIVALRASHEADPGTDRLASQILTPEEPCMAAAQ